MPLQQYLFSDRNINLSQLSGECITYMIYYNIPINIQQFDTPSILQKNISIHFASKKTTIYVRRRTHPKIQQSQPHCAIRHHSFDKCHFRLLLSYCTTDRPFSRCFAFIDFMKQYDEQCVNIPNKINTLQKGLSEPNQNKKDK